MEAAEVIALLKLEPGMRVLDAPCGHGCTAERLAAHGCLVTGIDRAPHFDRDGGPLSIEGRRMVVIATA